MGLWRRRQSECVYTAQVDHYPSISRLYLLGVCINRNLSHRFYVMQYAVSSTTQAPLIFLYY